MEISVYSDGQQQYGIKPLSTNYTDSLYIRAFNTFSPELGNYIRTKNIGILRSTYSLGNALYVFNLSPDLAKQDHFNLQKQGSVRLVLKFRQALAENVLVIAYAEFEK